MQTVGAGMQTVGALLREWRRRRGLSQLDLAIAADVSARHVSLVETGRSRPTADMVLRLADRLDVPLRDRNRLLLAAGFAPRFAERSLGAAALAAAQGAVRRVLESHEPYPAVVLDRRWNVLEVGRGMRPFLAGVAPDLLQPVPNLVRLALDPRGLAPLVANLADVRSVFRARILRQLAAAPDAELTALYDELLGPSPDDDGRSRPQEGDVVLSMVVRYGGRELRLFSTMTTFTTPLDVTLDELVVESYYPADSTTAEFLAGVGAAPMHGVARG
ncbi:helix-turn-helix domain-containing protein [Luteimicrobium sp. DT211]|uniref:helix-turn-helix domain-containing protein n=1 Tax=Luteimicrobium sp. DT211 TaxID=3393412 RepID=UPI003CF83AEA